MEEGDVTGPVNSSEEDVVSEGGTHAVQTGSSLGTASPPSAPSKIILFFFHLHASVGNKCTESCPLLHHLAICGPFQWLTGAHCSRYSALAE